jgi:hypothetical protein
VRRASARRGVLAFALAITAILTLTAVAAPRGAALAWVAAGDLIEARSFATAVVLPKDVLVFGGVDPLIPSVVRTSTEIVSAGYTIQLAQRLPGRVNHTLTVTGDLVVLAGGTEWQGGQWASVARTDLFDIAHYRWLPAPALGESRGDHGAVALLDGRVLVSGGTDGPRQLRSSEIFDPLTGRWSAAAAMPTPRSQFSMALLPNGLVLVAGGLEFGVPSNGSLLYDPARDRWETGPQLLAARVLHSTTVLPSGDVLLVAGQRDAAGWAERYDWRARRFVNAGTLSRPRMLAQSVALPDGRVVVVGGLPVDPSRTEFTPMNDAEMWLPDRNIWVDMPDPLTARAMPLLVVEGREVVALAGAGTSERALSSIERFGWR